MSNERADHYFNGVIQQSSADTRARPTREDNACMKAPSRNLSSVGRPTVEPNIMSLCCTQPELCSGAGLSIRKQWRQAAVRHLVQGHPRSSTLVSIECPYTVINSNFGRYLLPFSRYWSIKVENVFPTPLLFDAPAREIPSEFLDKSYPTKTRGMWLLFGENCMILSSTVFDWSTRVTDRRTGDRIYTLWRYSIIALCCRA